MEYYYFVQQRNVKKGPFTLFEIKQQKIYFDELVWRSDSENWKKASEFEELRESIIVKIPLTPIEKKRKDFNDHFIKKILPYSIVCYILISLFLSIVSFSIADNSWKKVKDNYITNKTEIGGSKETAYQKIIDNDKEQLKDLRFKLFEANQILNRSKKNTEELTWMQLHARIDNLGTDIWRLENDSTNYEYLNTNIQYAIGSSVIEPIFKIPVNVIETENIYGVNQTFLFRPYYAFFSRIYLTTQEQNNSGNLFMNIMSSSFLGLQFCF